MSRPTLICLLPVRNGEQELPGYLDSVARFVDGVVALDDGSTDSTASILSSHRLVRQVLSNPPRPSYAGWDDGLNRNRLLEAAGALAPDWVLSLDVDERMDEEDGLALRGLIEDGGRAGYGYLLALFTMADAADRCGVEPLWVARLFAHQPGQRFSDAGLHGKPIPDCIPRRRWVKTTLRIKHFGALTAQRRQERHRKYAEVDPERRWQRSYQHLLAAPARTMPWSCRPPGLPALAHTAHPAPTRPSPLITAVVIATNDEERIEAALGALIAQEDLPAANYEIVVVCSGSDGTAEIVRTHFPQVTLVELEGLALPGAARNAGLRVARGTYVVFPGSHVVVAPRALAAFLDGHRRGYAMVMGSMYNGTHTIAGWASYLLDNHTALPGRAAGPLHAPPVRCSYLRAALDRCGWFPEDRRTAEDTLVNTQLFRIGYGAYREPAAASTHFSPCHTSARLLRHHFGRGRGLAHVLLGSRRSGTAASAVILNLVGGPPRRLLLALLATARSGGADRRALLAAFPLACAAATASWLGTAFELALLKARRRSAG